MGSRKTTFGQRGNGDVIQILFFSFESKYESGGHFELRKDSSEILGVMVRGFQLLIPRPINNWNKNAKYRCAF